jgi:hypothetical protein
VQRQRLKTDIAFTSSQRQDKVKTALTEDKDIVTLKIEDKDIEKTAIVRQFWKTAKTKTVDEKTKLIKDKDSYQKTQTKTVTEDWSYW